MIIGAFVLFALITFVGLSNAVVKAPMPLSQSAVNLNTDMRKLWEDPITYTRNYIIRALANLEDTSKVAERLLKNQDDIGDAIKPIYGDEAGNKLAALLRVPIPVNQRPYIDSNRGCQSSQNG